MRFIFFAVKNQELNEKIDLNKHLKRFFVSFHLQLRKKKICARLFVCPSTKKNFMQQLNSQDE